MLLRFLFLVHLAGIAHFAHAASSEELRNHFEWGEYQKLVDTLEPYLFSMPDTLDSSECALYHGYLGVAYFAQGKIGDAQKHFSAALSFDSTTTLDRRYISQEIASLFTSTRINFSKQLLQSRSHDSLKTIQKQTIEANLHLVKQAEFWAHKREKVLWTVSLITIGAAFSGISANEYYKAKPSYRDFKNAAQSGDKMTYDRLQPIIRKANIMIFSCTFTAGICGLSGICLFLK